MENNGKGIFKDVTDEKAPGLKKIGMVSDALWTDYNGDNQMDLMLVGEWMPITLLTNKNGTFQNITNEVGFKDTEGGGTVLFKVILIKTEIWIMLPVILG